MRDKLDSGKERIRSSCPAVSNEGEQVESDSSARESFLCECCSLHCAVLTSTK